MPGEGTSFTIKIPLTLAIVSALIVEAAGERFAIPQLSVVELVRARANSEHRIERIKDTPVLRLRNKLLPLIHLKKLLKIDGGAEIERRERLHRRHAGRQPDLRHRRRRRVPHRGNRRQADVEQAAPHLDVLRQHHPRRRLGDHDPRSRTASRRRSAPRVAGQRDIAEEHDATRAAAADQLHLAARVPRRLATAEGGAAVAGHAPRGDRRHQDRACRTAATWCSIAGS